MADLAKLVVRLEAESSQLRKELERSNRKLESWEKRVAGTVGRVRRSFSRAFAGVGLTLGFATVASGIRSMVDEANNSQRQMLRLRQLVETTGGAAGMSAEQIDEFSRALARSTLASTEGVRDAASVLLTFRSISGNTFKETLTLAQDLSAAMGQDLRSSVLQLGKALEDPAKGLTALRRSGVSFTEAEQDMIKSLQASGRQLEAQAQILDKLRQQVGGAGAAEAGGLAGSVDTLSQNWGEFLENLGNSGPLQAASAFIDGLATRVQTLNRLLFSPDQEKFYELADRRAKLLERLKNPGVGRIASVLYDSSSVKAELADIEAQMRALQDKNVQRIKQAGNLHKQINMDRIAAVQNVAAVEDGVLKKLQGQQQQFRDLVASARAAINGDGSNPFTQGTVLETLRALDKAKTLDRAGDRQGALDAASKAVQTIERLAEAGRLSKQYADTLLKQASAIGEKSADSLVKLKLDDKAIAAEAERARQLIQGTAFAEPFVATLRWETPGIPNTPNLANGASRADGTPIVLNIGGERIEATTHGPVSQGVVEQLNNAALAQGAQ